MQNTKFCLWGEQYTYGKIINGCILMKKGDETVAWEFGDFVGKVRNCKVTKPNEKFRLLCRIVLDFN